MNKKNANIGCCAGKRGNLFIWALSTLEELPFTLERWNKMLMMSILTCYSITSSFTFSFVSHVSPEGNQNNIQSF